MRPALRQIDIDAAVAAARFAADQLLAEAVNPEADLTPADWRGLLTIARAVDAQAAVWAGLPARTPEAQRIIDQALAAVLPVTVR